MTANQSGQNDSEHMVQQSRPDEQAPEDTNPANLSSNPPEGPVSTNEGESSPSMSLHDVDVEIHFNLGVFARRDLTQGHEIIGAERLIFAVPRQPTEACQRRDLKPTEAVCFDEFKRDHHCNPSITNAKTSSLAATINHACPDCANATFRVAETYDITATLVKDVRKREQIFIDLGQDGPPSFVCPLCKSLCKNTRESTRKRRKRRFKAFLAKFNPRNMFKTAERSSE
ncbi:hypothetical protein J7337_001142 [Fusarium musae]|uniref:SET domain-containing protein n=1 Tax=Fusarium musae TaxID=1042133 RepID=A0A9P8IVP3_9HYPO|nr:hypothetical protein J7337_001142 [Fusarium musae]KAG9507589.1 hypothetical protein J7337_001142 [Fusarium musae]